MIDRHTGSDRHPGAPAGAPLVNASDPTTSIVQAMSIASGIARGISMQVILLPGIYAAAIVGQAMMRFKKTAG